MWHGSQECGFFLCTVSVCDVHTCDDEAFVALQNFGEEAGDNELGVNDEPDLFLDQTVSCYASTHKPVCKVHL